MPFRADKRATKAAVLTLTTLSLHGFNFVASSSARYTIVESSETNNNTKVTEAKVINNNVKLPEPTQPTEPAKPTKPSKPTPIPPTRPTTLVDLVLDVGTILLGKGVMGTDALNNESNSEYYLNRTARYINSSTNTSFLYNNSKSIKVRIGESTISPIYYKIKPPLFHEGRQKVVLRIDFNLPENHTTSNTPTPYQILQGSNGFSFLRTSSISPFTVFIEDFHTERSIRGGSQLYTYDVSLGKIVIEQNGKFTEFEWKSLGWF